jgi:hypothetical protein
VAEFFTERGVPAAAGVSWLNLAGQGIRALARVPAPAGYLLVSGPVGRQDEPFRLWHWSGAAAPPQPVAHQGGFARTEGLCPAIVGGRPTIVLVSDDGDRESGRPAQYRLLDPAALVLGR